MERIARAINLWRLCFSRLGTGYLCLTGSGPGSRASALIGE